MSPGNESHTPSSESPPWEITSETFPLVLSAGERRSFTSNTIYRDPKWRRKALAEALALSPNDAAALEIADGDRARLERLTDAAA